MTVENNHCLEKITKGVQNINVALKCVHAGNEQNMKPVRGAQVSYFVHFQ